MLKWSQQHTLNTGLIVIGLLAILSSMASLFASKILVHDMAVLAVGQRLELVDSQALRLIGFREVSDANAALLTGEEPYARLARSGSVALRERADRLHAQLAGPEGRFLLGRIRTTEQEYREAFEQALGAPAGRPAGIASAAVVSRGRAFELALDALVAHMEVPATAAAAATQASVERANRVFNLITSVSISLAVVLCIMLILLINRAYRDQARAHVLVEEGRTRSSAALDEAKATIQLKDQFLATVSHELRNPLAPILLWTQLLRSGTLEKAKADRALEVVERNVASLSELIDDLLDVSRVVSGKFRLDVRSIELATVIRAAVESQRPASEAKQIRLALVLDERTGPVSGDSERLQQVMGNLLSNAIKFTAKGGRVQIVLRRAESHVEIAVADTGIGIAPDFLPRIFEPFQQERNGSKRRHGGLGLGLSIVHHIVELHGGEIIAHSEGSGKGATFIVQLPLLGTSETNGVPWSRHPRAGEGHANVILGRLDKIKVLLVDDEPNANEAVQALLESCGAEVRVAGSAEQALQMLDVWRPDVLISDIAMPEEDGYALIRKVRTRSANQGGDIPAAALTAYAKIEDRVSILAAGFQMYLSKPADPSELIAVVASLAARRRWYPAEVPETPVSPT